MFKLVVLLSVAALAAAKPSLGVVPVAYSSVVPGVSSLSQYSSSVVHGAPLAYSAAGVYSPGVVSYPALAQAPHSPAVLLDAVHGVPLDTPEVVAARAAHYQAKALSGLHHLKKRSVAAVAPVTYSSLVSPYSYGAYSTPVVSAYSSPVVSAYSSPVATYSSPLVSAYSTSVVTSPLAYHGVHHLKKRSVAAVAPVASVVPYSTYGTYASPVVSTYSSPVVSYSSPFVSAYSTPVVTSPLAYHGVVPKALSVHPW